MRYSQSKDDNISTSGSDYFKQRFIDNGSKINSHLDGKSRKHSGNSLIFSPSIISKVASEYEIFQPLQSVNNKINEKQNFSGLKRQQFQTRKKQPIISAKNPFLSVNYNESTIKTKTNRTNDPFNNKIIQKRQSSQSHHIQSINKHQQIQGAKISSSNKNISKKLFQTKLNFDNVSELSGSQCGSNNSYYKQNSQHKVKHFMGRNSNLNNNTQKLIEPITLMKNCKSQDNLMRNVQFSTNNYYQNTSQQQSQCINQPHKLLEHIHFSIKNQQNILHTFKLFSQKQKQKVTSQFNHLQREIENKLNQIKTRMCEQIDQNYHQMIGQMNSLKGMAEIMWQHKTPRSSSISKNYYNQKISSQQREQRPQSSSKLAYKKLSSGQCRSPQMNSNLLQQLHQQDRRLQQYQETRKQYFNDQFGGQYQPTIDKGRLLKDMYAGSTRISAMIKQCENTFYQEVLANNNNNNRTEKQRFFYWANANKQASDILQSTRDKVSQLTQVVNDFCSCLDNRYVR